MTEEPKKELVANFGITKEPGYLYYFDKNGNAYRVKKTGERKRNKSFRRSAFNFLGIHIPRVLLNCYVSNNLRTVRKYGGCVGVTLSNGKELLGKKFRVILIPEESTNQGELKDECENELQETGKEE